MAYVPVEPREHDETCHRNDAETSPRRGMFDTLHCQRCSNLASRMNWTSLTCPAKVELTVEDLT